MRKLLNILVVILVLAAAICGAAPWLDGYLLKQRYMQYVSLINNANPNQNIRFTILNYSQGWLSSNVTAQIEITNPLYPLKFNVEENITHGPYIFDNAQGNYVSALAKIHSMVHTDSAIEQKMLGANATQGIMQLDSIISFSNDITTTITTPTFQFTTGDGTAVNWQGLRGNNLLHFSSNALTDISGTQTIGIFKLTSHNVTVFMQPIVAQQELHRENAGIWTGSSTLVSPEITASGMMIHKLVLQNTKLATASAIQANLFNGSLTTSINTIQTDQYTIQPFSFDLSINGLNAAALTKLKLQANTLTEPSLESSMGEVINAQTKVALQTALKSNYGNLMLQATVSWPELASPATRAQLDTNMNVQATIRISPLLLHKIVAAGTPFSPGMAPPPIAPIAPVNNLSEDEKFNQLIANLVQQGVLQIHSSLDVMQLEKQHLSPIAFAHQLETLAITGPISPTVVSQIKEKYSQLNFTAAPLPPVVTQTDPAKMQIDNWIKQGYITQDGDDDVITITRIQGEVKINGQPMPPILFPVPGAGYISSMPPFNPMYTTNNNDQR